MAIVVRVDRAEDVSALADAHRVALAVGIVRVSVELGLEQDALQDGAVDALELAAGFPRL